MTQPNGVGLRTPTHTCPACGYSVEFRVKRPPPLVDMLVTVGCPSCGTVMAQPDPRKLAEPIQIQMPKAEVFMLWAAIMFGCIVFFAIGVGLAATIDLLGGW